MPLTLSLAALQASSLRLKSENADHQGWEGRTPSCNCVAGLLAPCLDIGTSRKSRVRFIRRGIKSLRKNVYSCADGSSGNGGSYGVAAGRELVAFEFCIDSIKYIWKGISLCPPFKSVFVRPLLIGTARRIFPIIGKEFGRFSGRSGTQRPRPLEKKSLMLGRRLLRMRQRQSQRAALLSKVVTICRFCPIPMKKHSSVVKTWYLAIHSTN